MQTSYSLTPAVGSPGMIVDTTFFKDVVSRANPGGVIPYGTFVVRGTNPDKEVVAPGAAADITNKTLGVALASGVVPVDTTQPVAQYPLNSAVAVMKKGRVWVKTEDAAAPGGAVYVRYSGAGTIGGVRATTATGADTVVAGAKFVSTAAAGGLAQLELNL